MHAPDPTPTLLRRWRPATGLAVAVIGCVLSACPAVPTPVEVVVEEPDPSILPTPSACDDLGAVAVPFLPRASNDEVRQLYGDLLGSPIDDALFVRWTPLAQVRGFDTMTESRIDAQTLEEQLRTTEAVAALLVQNPEVMAGCPVAVADAPLCALHDAYDADTQFSGQQGQDCWHYLDANGTPLTFATADQRWIASDPGLFLWNNGLHPGINVDVVRRWVAPLDGNITLSGSVADVDGGGGDGIIVDIRTPAGVVFHAVIVNGGAPEAFNLPLSLRRGDAVDIIVRRGGTNSFDSTGLSAQVAFAAAVPSAGLTWENCGAAVVERVGSRAYRRPLRAEELADLKIVFDETLASAAEAGLNTGFSEGLQTALQAAILSPNVQYKPEFVPGGFSEAEAHFRRASRLALYFRSSFADDELWALASQNALGTDDVVRAQAERLLATDGARFVENFGGQWLDFRAPIGASSTPMEASMRRESHDVFAAILDEHQPPQRLISPGFTIVDSALANFYGLDDGQGVDAVAPTRITTDQRGGIFTQGNFLTKGGGSSDFKRVIHRGIFTLNRTLCSSVPMLDPATREEIAASVGGIDPELPLAERMQMHRSTSQRCLACHGQMDPLGLALEQFDDEGRFRETYEDGSAIHNDFDFNGTAVEDAAALERFIEGSADYQHCVAEKLFTFGLHRAIRPEERCVMDAISVVDGEPRSLHDIAIDAFVSSLRLTEER